MVDQTRYVSPWPSAPARSYSQGPPRPPTVFKSPMEEAFWTFHSEHPEVFEQMHAFALEWRSAHGANAKLGIKMLFERVRWEIGLRSHDGRMPELNNNHTAYYARLLMSRSYLEDMFNLRQQRIQATIGPSGDTVPPNVHVGPQP
jgi:hypothetical protein